MGKKERPEVVRVVVALAAMLVLVGIVGGPVMAEGAPAPLPLPFDHERRLAAGEVIVVEALPPGASGDAQGGTGLAVVRAPVEKVWSILVDYPGHPRFYPRVVGVEVLSADRGHKLVRYTVAIGFLSFGFHMDTFQDAARRRIEWRLAPGHPNNLFRENSGYWQVESRQGASLVTYSLAVRTLLPGFLTRGAERDSLVETINGMRRLAEKADGSGAK
jgi:ribosome-associated toxin RatA of RatAB toxin-antitoxin module